VRHGGHFLTLTAKFQSNSPGLIAAEGCSARSLVGGLLFDQQLNE
jgi:hypothetical protein